MSKRTTKPTAAALKSPKTKSKGPGKQGPPKGISGQGAASGSDSGTSAQSSGNRRGGQGRGGAGGGGKGPDHRKWQELRKAAFRQAEKEVPRLFEKYLPRLAKVPVELDDLSEDSMLHWELEWN